MSDASNPKIKVIVLGTSYSGSGAIYDYLSTRSDCFDPLQGSEYLLPQIPYGLMQLRATTGPAFHHATADYAFRKFLSVAAKLAKPRGKLFYGKDFENLLPGFMNEISRLVEEATVSQFPFRIAWRDIDKTISKKLMDLFLERFLRVKNVAQNTYLPVTEDEFIKLTQNMHERLFSLPANSQHQFILLNQAGSGLNPISSTDFFANRKVILVKRDPRDQFAEMKLYKKAFNVKEFIKWYKEITERIAVSHPDLYSIRFEDFVLNHNTQKTAICQFVGIPDTVKSLYSPERSTQNISKFKSILSSEEASEIEKKLTNYCSHVKSD